MSSDSHASDPCSRLGGSSWLCYGIISLQSSMKCEKFISGATLLSEGELESTWPCSIQKYCRVQRNREFVPVQWGRWGRLTMKRCGRESTGRLYGRGTNPCVTCWKDPYNGPERGKLREVNPVSAINTDEEKSGKRRAEARGNSAPLPHMAHSPRILSGSSRVPGHWEAKSSAVPGRHTAGWANEPRDKGLNYYYY